MKLCSMKREVRDLFDITNLVGTIFDVYDTIDEGVAAFGTK